MLYFIFITSFLVRVRVFSSSESIVDRSMPLFTSVLFMIFFLSYNLSYHTGIAHIRLNT